MAQVPVSAPVTITVGAGGNPGNAGGTSSFGTAVSATGGGAGNNTPGTGTVSVGTALRTSNAITSNPFYIFSGSFAQPTPGPALVYSASVVPMAGARGNTGAGGMGGAIVVEFIG
jgi:hypothetical protein